MRVRVLLFGALKDLTARESETVELPERSTVRHLLRHYAAGSPAIAKYAGSLAVAVNREYAVQDVMLCDGDEVALLPPVSGGRPEIPGSETPVSATAGHRIRLQREPISAEACLADLKQGEDGAVVVFDGIVRNNTRGRRTLYLIYESYEAMAIEQMRALVSDAKQRFSVREIILVHRLGRLEIGETSVWIAVASAHRGAAFEACRWLIDTLKKTVPIWKKEHFEDGAIWADGEPFPPAIALQPGDVPGRVPAK